MDDSEDKVVSFSRFKLPLALTIVGLTLLSAGIYYTLQKNTAKEIKFSLEQNNATSSAQIMVHLAGEVVNPGVYTLPAGSRMNDLITKAGGFTQTASQDYINKVLNLATVLKDGAKIYIPKKEESGSGQVAGSSQTAGALININTASLSDLDVLPDVGSARAQKIIDNRPYSAIEELVEKKIISQTIFEKIKEKISVY